MNFIMVFLLQHCTVRAEYVTQAITLKVTDSSGTKTCDSQLVPLTICSAVPDTVSQLLFPTIYYAIPNSNTVAYGELCCGGDRCKYVGHNMLCYS